MWSGANCLISKNLNFLLNETVASGSLGCEQDLSPGEWLRAGEEWGLGKDNWILCGRAAGAFNSRLFYHPEALKS